MNLHDDDDRTVAAAEYVLGTLDAADRADVERQLATDPRLRAEVYAWQDRLLPLNARVPAEQPPDRLWTAIAARIATTAPLGAAGSVGAANPADSTGTANATGTAGTPGTTATAGTAGRIGTPGLAAPAANDALWRSRRRWRTAALLSMAASVALAAVMVMRPAEPQIRYITLLQAPDTQRTGWLVEATSGERIRLVPLEGGAIVPAGKSVQFWTKPQGASRPTSLGLVDPGARLELPVERSPGLGEQQLFELTLEPQGGSPTGLPTGPILFVGRSVRL